MQYISDLDFMTALNQYLIRIFSKAKFKGKKTRAYRSYLRWKTSAIVIKTAESENVKVFLGVHDGKMQVWAEFKIEPKIHKIIGEISCG